MTDKNYFYGTGRRKTSVARVQLHPGTGQVLINGKPMQDIFTREAQQMHILEPLRMTNTANKFTIMVKVEGGGVAGQAGAIRHGIARALAQSSDTLRPVLRRGGLLTRDPRMKERKKPGLKRARKAPQYTKR